MSLRIKTGLIFKGGRKLITRCHRARVNKEIYMDLRSVGYAGSGEEGIKHVNYEMGHTRRFQSENEYLRERVKSCERGLLSIYQARISSAPLDTAASSAIRRSARIDSPSGSLAERSSFFLVVF